MLFPAISDLVFATTESIFGFPGTRGGFFFSGPTTVILLRRAASSLIRRWVLMSETFDVASATNSSLVDIVVDSRSDAGHALDAMICSIPKGFDRLDNARCGLSRGQTNVSYS